MLTTITAMTVDEDQCAENNGGCQQNCLNEIPGYNCSCEPGYTLNEDGFSCDGESAFSTVRR